MKLILLVVPKERCKIPQKLRKIIWPESFVEFHDAEMQEIIPWK